MGMLLCCVVGFIGGTWLPADWLLLSQPMKKTGVVSTIKEGT